MQGERTNEVAKFNVKNFSWERVKLPEGARRPCPRSGHSAVIVGQTMYIFGGKADNSLRLNDLWGFNLQSNTWTLVKPVDEVVPEVRSGHSACVYDGLILIFGGIYEVTKELNDTYAFSLQ